MDVVVQYEPTPAQRLTARLLVSKTACPIAPLIDKYQGREIKTNYDTVGRTGI